MFSFILLLLFGRKTTSQQSCKRYVMIYVHLRTHWKSDWIDVILVWQAIWFNLSSSIELALSGVHESSDPISAPKGDLEFKGDLESMGDPTTSAPMSGVSFVFETDFGSTHDPISMGDLWFVVFLDLGSTHDLVSMSDLWSLDFREDFGPIHDPGPSSKPVTIVKSELFSIGHGFINTFASVLFLCSPKQCLFSSRI